MFGHLKPLWSGTLLVFIINIPFGFWRARVRRFSAQWLLAIHIPVPIIISLRYLLGIGWQLSSFPLFIGAFFIGQLAGGRFKHFIDGL